MNHRPFARRALIALAAALPLLVTAGTASSQNLAEPKGRVILTVDGKIGATNRGSSAVFDMAMIEALPQHSFTTRTPWYDKPVKFTGPRLADLLAAVQAKGTTVNATAINDYTIRIPVSDAAAQGVIVARLLDDKPMAVRDKGPLFVVYPFDSKAELRSSTYYERSIWQLKRMNIE